MKNNKKQTDLEKFMEKEFDDMIKYANWHKGKNLKNLIKKELRNKK